MTQPSSKSIITILTYLQHIVVINNSIVWHLFSIKSLFGVNISHQICLYKVEYIWTIYNGESRVTFNCTTVNIFNSTQTNMASLRWRDFKSKGSVKKTDECSVRVYIMFMSIKTIEKTNTHNYTEPEKHFISWINVH